MNVGEWDCVDSYPGAYSRREPSNGRVEEKPARVDLLGDATYDREGGTLQAQGLYLDEPPWKAYVFSLTRRD